MRLLQILALAWAVSLIGFVLLLRHAARQVERARADASHARSCYRGNHRDTLDTEVDGLPHLAWRCLDCGDRVMLGAVYASGTNKTTRRVQP